MINLENEIIKIAATQGVWAALSVILIFYILKNQEKRDLKQEERENNYQGIISNLTINLNVVEDMKKNIEDIKNHIFYEKK